jgi:hypothetical protein
MNKRNFNAVALMTFPKAHPCAGRTLTVKAAALSFYARGTNAN